MFSHLFPFNSSYSSLRCKVHPFLHSNAFKSNKGKKSHLRAVLKCSLLIINLTLTLTFILTYSNPYPYPNPCPNPNPYPYPNPYP